MKTRIKSPASEESGTLLEVSFQKLHSLSVTLNATALIAGLALLWLTAQGLQL